MKKTLTKALILTLIFVAALGAFWFFGREEKPEEITYTTMDEATLPVVSFEFEGLPVNRQYGYTGAMNPAYIRDTLTPLPASRELSLTAETYGTPVKKLGFELRSLDGERLIERSDRVDFTSEGTEIQATLTFGDLLEAKQEYLLCVLLQTDRYETVSYYTRVRYYEDTPAAEMLAFALDFSDRTFDRERLAEMKHQLESDGSADNGTLGYVNIKSSLDQVAWGDLAPTRLEAPRIALQELDETTATLTLFYGIEAADEDGDLGEYQVEEDFYLRKVNDVIYLMRYERNMSQDFEMAEARMFGGVVELGILSEADRAVAYQTAGTYGAFVADGELWQYDNKTNHAVRVFSFKGRSGDRDRTRHDEHDYEIIRLGDNGDMDFLVYGYMNRGAHEGECGLAFYQYRREENELKEVFYIPSDKPFSVMEAEVSMLSYIGEQELLYLVFDNSIYAIDFNGMEPVLIAGNLKRGAFAISEDKSRVAWQEEESAYGCKAICVMDLKNGQINRITAPEGEYLRVLDFIGSDFVYGIAREEDTSAVPTISLQCPMYALEIVDAAGQVQMRYEIGGVYLTGIHVDNDRVLLKRVSRDASGGYAEIASDSLIQNEEKESGGKSLLSVRGDEKRQRIYLLNLASSSGASDEPLTISAPKQAVAGGETFLHLTTEKKEDPRYFAYSYGQLSGIYYTAGEAIDAVYAPLGLVVDARQNRIWNRLNLSYSRTLELPEPELAAGGADRLRACLVSWFRFEGCTVDAAAELAAGKLPWEILRETFPGRAVSLEGSDVLQTLYYLDSGHPVLALSAGTKAELIVGYDNYNFQIYDPISGQVYKMAREDAAAYYGNQGNIFVTIVG